MLLAVVRLYSEFRRFETVLLGEFDEMNEALLLDLLANSALVAAVYLLGFRRDACCMWVFGRAFEAMDHRGLLEPYRKLCMDRLDRML